MIVHGAIGIAPQTEGGLATYRNLDLNETGVLVKGAPGQVFGYYLFNASAATVFIKLYNKATAPTVGTDTPVMTIGLPAGQAANNEWANGIQFPLGIGIGATTGVADNDTTGPGANELVANLLYK